jgi:NhaA family Na+:H+ antiporter
VNAGVAVSPDAMAAALVSPIALGIAGGLLVGKLLGIVGASWLAVRMRVAVLPDGVAWGHIVGVSLLAGIGFTVSLFITELAFADPAMIDAAKLAILVTSAVAGGTGFLVLKRVARPAA